MKHDDDAALMKSAARGDSGAFSALVTRYQKQVFNFFLRSTGSFEDAEDLSQQLFVNLFRSAKRYRPKALLRTYIFRIAANLAASHARKRRIRKGRSLDEMFEKGIEPEAEGQGVDPSIFVEGSELQQASLHALFELPQEWRIAMELRVSRGFSNSDIAEAMGKTVPAVESILYRARERLALALSRFRDDSDEC